MKKSLQIAALFLIVCLPLAAQTTLADFEAGFADFAGAIANSLPFNTTIGQQWSDAFIGAFPHLGLGVSAGATTIPYTAIEPVLNIFSLALPSDLTFIENYGVPLPAYSIDARLGLPLLPMDIGFKFGMLPAEVKVLLPANLFIDYLLIGGDVRFALFKGKPRIPALSVGIGYNYLHGTLGVDELFNGADHTISDVGGHTIAISNPRLNFYWETSVIDLKMQASMNWFVLTPFAGAGVSYGISTAGGGLAADILFDGAPITAEHIALIQSQLGSAAPDLTNQSITVASEANGWAVRVFGGIGLNFVIIRLDAEIMLNLMSMAYGAAINLRIQL